MSSTIYYKGTLKDSSSVDELYEAVRRQSAGLNCRIVREEDAFYIEFTEGMSEPLLFRLDNKKVSWFCKWDNSSNPEEYSKIFELFAAIKPFFKALRIDDDAGAWHEYLLKTRPCKIRLRELSGPAELGLLAQNCCVSDYDFSGFLKPGMRFIPYSDAVYCVIARDFLRIFKADRTHDLDRERILKLANKLRTDDEPFTQDNFAFMFPYMLLQIWIGCCLTYKVEGRVFRLPEEVRGLKTNKLAAEFGLLSVFLNIHSGTVNYKHAEMKRFAAQHLAASSKFSACCAQAKTELTNLIRDYIAGNNIDTMSNGPVLIPVTGPFKEALETIFTNENKPAPDAIHEDTRQSLQALVSILDYLGFKYVGAEK